MTLVEEEEAETMTAEIEIMIEGIAMIGITTADLVPDLHVNSI